jgi:predicted ABC-type transport system involved in lysophospholipase L1 biosynthesis ATPase subunit
VQRLLMDLNREQHITLIIVTHNEAFAAWAHRTLHLQDGQLR